MLLVSNRRIIMKATKKIVCLALAIVMTALAFVMPVVAADEAPLVIVDGINSTRLYTDFGTENQKEAFFGSDTDIEAMITDVGGAFVGGLVKYGYNNKDFEAFGNTFIPALNKYFEPIAYNTDGTPKHELGFYETKKTIYLNCLLKFIFRKTHVCFTSSFSTCRS